MNDPILAGIDRINHLKARIKFYGDLEMRMAQEVQKAIQKQSVLFDELTNWEYEVAKLRAQDNMKGSDKAWGLKRIREWCSSL